MVSRATCIAALALANLLFFTSCAVVPTREPNRYLFAYGVADYYDEDVNDLVGPATDVPNIAAAFAARGYQTYERIDCAATLAAMQTDMNNLANTVQPGDLVVFYFSGHGVEAGTFAYGSPAALVPHDFDLDNPMATIITPEVLAGFFEPLPSGVAVIVIMDACFSAGLIGSQGTAVDGVDANHSTKLLTWKGPNGGPPFFSAVASYFEGSSGPAHGREISFLASAGSAEESWEYTEDFLTYQGIFTELLVRRVSSGSADVNGDGRTSLDELHAAVRGDIRREWNSVLGPDQGPLDLEFLPHRSNEYYDIILF